MPTTEIREAKDDTRSVRTASSITAVHTLNVTRTKRHKDRSAQILEVSAMVLLLSFLSIQIISNTSSLIPALLVLAVIVGDRAAVAMNVPSVLVRIVELALAALALMAAGIGLPVLNTDTFLNVLTLITITILIYRQVNFAKGR